MQNFYIAYISDVDGACAAFSARPASWCAAPRWNFVAIQCAASPCTLGRWTRISPGPLHGPERSTRCTLSRIFEIPVENTRDMGMINDASRFEQRPVQQS